MLIIVFFFKQKTAYDMRISDWSSDVCSSDLPEHGFQFPGTFEITAMGPATAGLEVEIPKLLTASGINVLHESISWRGSSGGKFVSVKLSFRADDRAQYEAAHEALRAHPEVKWTL